MRLPELYLSKPGVCFPGVPVDNAETIRRVRACFKGTEREFAHLAAAIEHVFGLCNTKQRYLEADTKGRVADYAVSAARECLQRNRTSVDEVDLVICGGIARQYFEPATAMEVAAKLGLKTTHAFDVTAACVGHLEAIEAAAAYLNLRPSYRTALVCTCELSRHFLSYDIQKAHDLHMKAAGLSIGNAAACVLLRRTPFPRGSIRLHTFDAITVPAHWDLCQVPIDGTLFSSSVELMRLAKMIPPWIRERLAGVGLRPCDIDHYVFHQPSEIMVRKVLQDTGADPAKGIYTHAKYGNTASASVAVTYNQLLEERTLRAGERIALGSAAAGFAIVLATGTWAEDDSGGRHD